jgi:hypothetical protein
MIIAKLRGSPFPTARIERSRFRACYTPTRFNVPSKRLNKDVCMPAHVRQAAMLALLFAVPAFAAPALVQPATKAINIGSVRVFALSDALNVVPNDGTIFGIGIQPAIVGAVLRQAHAPSDTITLAVDALLVEIRDRMVLLDTGFGSKVGGVLQQSLALAGVKPGQITDVLITHSHGDHIGGLLRADGALAFSPGRNPHVGT